MPAPGELLFVAPRRAKPPRHLADLSPADRRTAVGELGQPPFRASQLSRHYFSRLVDDAAAMTDIPAASREALIGTLMPTTSVLTSNWNCRPVPRRE